MAIQINYDLCEASGVCAIVCPEDVMEYENGRISIINQPACTDCWICVENCTAGAIEID
jgi:NAD-dependent dihydropyrimidine dehydrogenase PreA subunit